MRGSFEFIGLGRRNLEGGVLVSGLLGLIPGSTVSVKDYARANNSNLFQDIPVYPILI